MRRTSVTAFIWLPPVVKLTMTGTAARAASAPLN